VSPYLTPTSGSDATPPDVTLTSHNSGETLLGNDGINVTWLATDASSGVATVDIMVSLDDGASYDFLARGLDNTGAHTVFIPNRPSTTAWLRVVATDNFQNVGHDDSDLVLMVADPMLGIAPTTLRDFDLPGTQPHSVAPLADPANCAACHGNYDAAVEPTFNWQGSMMAHASRDILMQASMVIANQDAPDSGDLCLRCHIPYGWLQGRSVPTDGSQMLTTDMHGVSCDMCHRMVDPIAAPENPVEDTAILAALDFVPQNFGNGMYVIDPVAIRRGPFTDPAPGHDVIVSPFHREAAFCGTCHDVSNSAFQRAPDDSFPPNPFDTPPDTDSAHNLMAIERTYSEWFYSDYNTPAGVFAPEFGGNLDFVASCQDCHMRDVTGEGASFGNPPTRTDLPLHDMTGGSTWLPSLLATQYPGDVNETAINAGIDRARYMLQNAADLELTTEPGELYVKVINKTGHKLPTGYPEGRRIWINVRFLDADQNLVGESGAYDASTGVLDHDADLKVYEAKPGLDTDTAALVGVEPGPSFHFVLNNKIYKDNRIPPLGFTNANYELFGGTPIGATYEDGQNWDQPEYYVPIGAVSADVTLYYQSTSKEFIEFLLAENHTDNTGQQLYDLWNNNGKCPPEIMRQTSIAVTFVVPGDIDGDADVDDADTTLFVAVLLGLETDPTYVARCDLNDSGTADRLDIQGLVAALLGS